MELNTDYLKNDLINQIRQAKLILHGIFGKRPKQSSDISIQTIEIPQLQNILQQQNVEIPNIINKISQQQQTDDQYHTCGHQTEIIIDKKDHELQVDIIPIRPSCSYNILFEPIAQNVTNYSSVNIEFDRKLKLSTKPVTGNRVRLPIVDKIKEIKESPPREIKSVYSNKRTQLEILK